MFRFAFWHWIESSLLFHWLWVCHWHSGIFWCVCQFIIYWSIHLPVQIGTVTGVLCPAYLHTIHSYTFFFFISYSFEFYSVEPQLKVWMSSGICRFCSTDSSTQHTQTNKQTNRKGGKTDRQADKKKQHPKEKCGESWGMLFFFLTENGRKSVYLSLITSSLFLPPWLCSLYPVSFIVCPCFDCRFWPLDPSWQLEFH